MKIILKSLAISIVVFGIFYLIGCFYNLSFDIRKWSEESRLFMSLMFLLAFLISFRSYIELEKENNKQL